MIKLNPIDLECSQLRIRKKLYKGRLFVQHFLGQRLLLVAAGTDVSAVGRLLPLEAAP